MSNSPTAEGPRMRALSIKQPFAEQILRGTKIFEYRSRPTKVRDRVYIYAALKPRPAADWEGLEFQLADVTVGMLSGTVEIVGCDQEAPGRYAWALRSPERLETPIAPTRHPQPIWFYPFDDAPALGKPLNRGLGSARSNSTYQRRHSMAKTAKKRSGPGRKGYSAEKKAEILAAAKKEGLSGEQVAKKFGISTLTFYRWRGPVRGKKKRGRPVGSKNKATTSARGGRVKVDGAAVRREVQAQVRKMLPQIIREEVAAALRGR
jgi:transposase-like protein